MDKYIVGISTVNVGTGKEYNRRLLYFSEWVTKTYSLSIDELIKTLTIRLRGPKIDVFELLSSYVSYLHKKGNVTAITLKSWIITIKNFLEYHDVDISPRKFKLKVKMPKVIRSNKDAITKEDIVLILNACSTIKLKTYVMFLSATGCRAREALPTRLGDYDFSKQRVFIRGEYAKTKTDRYVFLTNELVEQLKSWITYKYRR